MPLYLISYQASGMIHKAVFENLGNGFRWITLIFLMLMGALIGMLTGFAIQKLFGIADPESLASMRIMQLSTQIGLFFLPPLCWAFLFGTKPLDYLGLRSSPRGLLPVYGVLLMLSALPLVHGLAEWNQSVTLPESLSSIEQHFRGLEDRATAITKTFLSVSTSWELLFNLLMIAVIPALGEELLFRGVIQKQLMHSTRNAHLAVIISSLIFSILHFQFFGLVPRFLLGLFLGYFYLWSGSLWVPVLMHFINNALAVVAFYLHHNGSSQVAMEDFGAVSTWWQWTLSVLISLSLCIAAYRQRQVD